MISHSDDGPLRPVSGDIPVIIFITISVDCPFSAQRAGDISPASVVRLRVLALKTT